MTHTIIQVDAFTARPFAGNPAAVCLLDAPRDDQWLQAVAAEMNLAETAYLWRQGEEFQLRWFTPAVEADLCGHATLASAHMLWERGHVAPEATIRFHTRSGVLTARHAGDMIELDFPVVPVEPCAAPPELLQALGASTRFVGYGGKNYLVELESDHAVRELQPNLLQLKTVDASGVIVTARSDDAQFDFVSRYFAPAAGIDEDPVTGSAHCSLGPYWEPYLGKRSFVAYQASRRGGIVRVELQGDRVLLRGHAVTVLVGELLA